MKELSVKYRKNREIAPYQHEHVEVEIGVEYGETLEQCFEYAKTKVEKLLTEAKAERNHIDRLKSICLDEDIEEDEKTPKLLKTHIQHSLLEYDEVLPDDYCNCSVCEGKQVHFDCSHCGYSGLSYFRVCSLDCFAKPRRSSLHLSECGHGEAFCPLCWMEPNQHDPPPICDLLQTLRKMVT